LSPVRTAGDSRRSLMAGTSAERAIRAVVLRYFECLNGEDWSGMRSIWRADGELRAVGARPRNDREGVIGYFSKLFGPWPEHEDNPTRVVVFEPDGIVLAEVTFTGRTPDGRQVSFDAIDVFDIVDGAIQKLTSWYDIEYARRSLADRV
jgi:ketosteroid isomerase-like protein